VIQAELDRDLKMLRLVSRMKKLYSFVSPLDTLRKENASDFQALEDVIREILTQTVECVNFIQAYFGRSFAGKCT
jgi:hypothetical protein